MNNVLFINKPAGMTSFDVCFKLRKVLHTKKIGHTGTLDPLATGVMVVLFDKATKANQFLTVDRKSYSARVKCGIMTDTLDIDGQITERSDFDMPSREMLETAITQFKGTSLQKVPMTSAIKIAGRKLYEYQRNNIVVEIPERQIEVFDIHPDEIFADGFSFSCTVSSGTYIRALTRDICARIGTIGVISALERTAVDDIRLADCDELSSVLEGYWKGHSLYELLSKRYETIDYPDEAHVMNGKDITCDKDDEYLFVTHDRKPLAIYRKQGNVYHCARGLW